MQILPGVSLVRLVAGTMRRGNYSFLADSLAISNTQFIYLSRCIQRGSKLLDIQSFYRADQQPTSQHGTVHSLASRGQLGRDVSKILHNLIRPKASLV